MAGKKPLRTVKHDNMAGKRRLILRLLSSKRYFLVLTGDAEDCTFAPFSPSARAK
jgi:hypothetical protein